MFCLNPIIHNIPDNNWFCPNCDDNYILNNGIDDYTDICYNLNNMSDSQKYVLSKKSSDP